MTQFRRYLKTLLTVLALLVPLASWASGDSEKALLDTDFGRDTTLNKYSLEVLKGHIRVTKDEFTITIPAQTYISEYTYKDSPNKQEVSHPALTIKGDCEWEREENGWVYVYPKGKITVSPQTITIVEKWDEYSKSFERDQYDGEWVYIKTYTWKDQYTFTQNQEPHIIATKPKSLVSYMDHGGLASKGSIEIELKWDQFTTTKRQVYNGSEAEYTTYKWGDMGYAAHYIIKGVFEEVQVGEDGMVASAEDDTDAPDEEGPWGTLIPIGVSSGIIGYLTYLANKYRRRRKAAKDEDPEDSDEGDEDDDEEDDPDQLEMRFYKNFDGTLITGDAGRRVSACIVRHPAKGPEWVDENLTRQIEITSNDNYLVVDDDGMVNGWRSCFVSAPEDPDPPKEGVVRFRLSVDRGTYTNRVHFRIEKGEVQFDQENLTIPAGCKTAIELPFAVPGFEGESGVSAFISGSDGSTKDYSVEVKWDERKGHYFAIIQDLLPEPQKDECIPGKFIEYTLHIVAEHERGTKIEGTLPVLRFFMGLALEFKDKGEVGCYITEYDPMKHRTREELRMKAGGKVYMTQENQVILTLYDYDFKDNTLLKVAPVPVEKDGFVVKAKDGTKQDLVDKLGLQLEPLADRCDDGRLGLIRCRKGVLDAPNRIDAECTIKVKYQGPNNDSPQDYECTHTMRLASQPRREEKDMADSEALRKKDQHIFDRLMHIVENITQTGQLNRMFPLVKYTEMQLEGYDPAYGYDARNVKRIESTYARLVMGEIGGVDEELPPELGITDELEWWFAAFKQVEKDIGFIGRIVAAVGSWGISELIFMPVDFAEEIREYVWDKNGDSSLKMFWIGVKNAAFMALAVKGTASTLTAKNVTRQGMREALQNARKGFEKPYNTLKGWLFRESAEKSLEATRRASSVAEMRLTAAKTTPPLPGERSLDKAMKMKRAKAADRVERLRTAIDMAEQNPDWTNISLRNQLILEVQGDKQAMYMLKNASEKYNKVRKELNGTLKSIYEITDKKSFAELSRKYPGREIKVFNASSSKAEQLASGKTITMDRDITYYFVDENNVVHYLPQEEVMEIYNRNFYETTRNFVSKNKVVAESSTSASDVYNKYAKAKDQRVLQDVLNDPESFGTDWEKMADKSRHGEALTNPTKVGDAMTFKGHDRFSSAERLLQQAEQTADDAERLLLQGEAVDEYMEGLRQMAKEFNNFVKPYDIARYKVNGTSMIPQHMREAVEMVEAMFKPGSTVSIDEIQRAFKGLNYSFWQFADDMGACMKRITSQKSWEIAR